MITPLVEFIHQRRIDREKFREEKKDERRRKEFEKKKQRELERINKKRENKKDDKRQDKQIQKGKKDDERPLNTVKVSACFRCLFIFKLRNQQTKHKTQWAYSRYHRDKMLY